MSAYIDLSVHYIKQIDAFRREVCRIAKTKGADEVVRRLNSSQVIDGEYQKFYQSFDSFLSGYLPPTLSDRSTSCCNLSSGLRRAPIRR